MPPASYSDITALSNHEVLPALAATEQLLLAASARIALLRALHVAAEQDSKVKFLSGGGPFESRPLHTCTPGDWLIGQHFGLECAHKQKLLAEPYRFHSVAATELAFSLHPGVHLSCRSR